MPLSAVSSIRSSKGLYELMFSYYNRNLKSIENIVKVLLCNALVVQHINKPFYDENNIGALYVTTTMQVVFRSNSVLKG